MKKLIWMFAVCLVLILNGCAVSREAARSAYETARVCCNSLDQLRYEKLPLENLRLFDIDERSDMFAFDTGRSFVLAVELPPLKPPIVVRIKSFALGDHIKDSQIFCPVVLVLDSHHQVLSRQLPPPKMSLSTASFSETAEENRWGLPLKYQWDLPVDDQRAQYLVIYTDAQLLASGEVRQVPSFVSVILPGFVTILPTGQKVSVRVPYSAFGRVSLQVLPSSPSATP